LSYLIQQLNDHLLMMDEKESEYQRWITHIQKLDVDNEKRREEYESLLKERDSLAQEVQQKNYERSQLQEKLKVTEKALGKRERQNSERLDQIHGLKQSTKALQREIYNLKRFPIASESSANKTSEKGKPLNNHRWMRSGGSDPTECDMIIKIQTLQKRLIRKTEEVNHPSSAYLFTISHLFRLSCFLGH